MSVIKSYKIDGSNLQLETYLYWGFQPNQPDAVQVWRLTNVDASDLNVSELEKLIAYEEDADYEQQIIGNRIRLKIATDLDNAVYTFTCDNINTQKRPYNVEELTSFLMRHIDSYQEQEAAFIKQRRFVEEVTKFVERSIERKLRILEESPDGASASRLKATHQLELLRELLTMMQNSQPKQGSFGRQDARRLGSQSSPTKQGCKG